MIETARLQRPNHACRFAMAAADKPALSALIAPRSVEEFFAGFTPEKAGYFLSNGDPRRGHARFIHRGHLWFTNWVESRLLFV